MSLTKLQALIDPEVMGEMVTEALSSNNAFGDLLVTDTTLEGQAGSVITLPIWDRLGEAVVVAEGDDIPLQPLTTRSRQVGIEKIGLGVNLTKEALLSGYGNPLSEAIKQIAESITVSNNTKAYTLLSTEARLVYDATGSPLEQKVIANALALFGDEVHEGFSIICSPEALATIRTNSEWIDATDWGVEQQQNGAVGRIWGGDVRVTNYLRGKNEIYLVRSDAIRKLAKSQVEIEVEKNIINQSFYVIVNEIRGMYINNYARFIKIINVEENVIENSGTGGATPFSLEEPKTKAKK